MSKSLDLAILKSNSESHPKLKGYLKERVNTGFAGAGGTASGGILGAGAGAVLGGTGGLLTGVPATGAVLGAYGGYYLGALAGSSAAQIKAIRDGDRGAGYAPMSAGKYFKRVGGSLLGGTTLGAVGYGVDRALGGAGGGGAIVGSLIGTNIGDYYTRKHILKK